MSFHRNSEESSSHESESQRLQDNEIPVRDSADSGDTYIPPLINSRRPHEDSNRSNILEALPLLRRPSIYLDRTQGNVSRGTARGPIYGSDDGGSIRGDIDEPLVRVQSGVKKVEAITMLWTRKSLIVAYVRLTTL
jgi:hypothetical protein